MLDSCLYSELAKQYLLCLRSAGKKHYPVGSCLALKEVSGYSLVYIISGHGTMRTTHIFSPVEAGSVCLFSSEITGSLFFDKDTDLYLIGFEGSPALYYLSFFPEKPWTVASPYVDTAVFYFERLVNHNSFAGETLNAKNLTDLLTLLSDISEKAPRPAKKAPIQALNIREYIRRHYKEHISLDSLSKVFNINKYQICRTFKEAFSLSVLQYQFELRLITAAELLKSTAMTVGEISCYLGFEDPYSMIRLFKRKYSCTPGSYRKGSRLTAADETSIIYIPKTQS